MSLSTQDLQAISSHLESITEPLRQSVMTNTEQVRDFQKDLSAIDKKLAVAVNNSDRNEKIMFGNRRSIDRINKETQKANEQAVAACKSITTLTEDLAPVLAAHQEVKPYARMARNVLGVVFFGLSTFVTAYITVEVKNAKSIERVQQADTATNRPRRDTRGSQGGGSK